MPDERVIAEIMEINKHLSSIKSIEEISSKLKNILIEYKDSVSDLDSSMYSFVQDLSEENMKIEKLAEQLNALVAEKNDLNNFLKLESTLKEVNDLVKEQNITIQNLCKTFVNNKDEGEKSIQEIKLIISDIEKNFYPLVDEIKCSTLKLSNFLKYSILDELEGLRKDISNLNIEKDKLMEEIKFIRNEINNDYLFEIQSVSKKFTDAWTQMQIENNEMKRSMELVINQNTALINLTETLKDKNEAYKDFINEIFATWSKENIRWFAKKGK